MITDPLLMHPIDPIDPMEKFSEDYHSLFRRLIEHFATYNAGKILNNFMINEVQLDDEALRIHRFFHIVVWGKPPAKLGEE